MSEILIKGRAKGSADAAYKIAKQRGAKRLEFTRDYFKALYSDAAVRGIDADALVAQWDLETGSGTSDYWVRDGNPAGLAAFDDGSNWGLTFSPQKAARAHVTHMARYLGIPNVPADWIATDARWQAVADGGYVGSVASTADLGNGRWATDPRYAEGLRARYVAYWGEPTTGKEKGSMRTPSVPTGWKLYNVAGLSEQIALPVPLIIDLIPPSQTLQRPGIRRQQPGYWVQHETANSNPGADADMHRRYMHNGALGESGQPQTLGYHFTNDDHQIFQMVPIDEVTWQAADDAGPGNMSGISNELCINQGIDHAKARHVAEALAAGVLGALGLGADRVKRHWDFNFNNSPDKRHHCPDLMMNENYWPTFLENVGKLLTGQHGGFGSLYPEGLDKGLAARWFGSVKLNDIKYEFSPDGPVSNAWLRLGRYPRLKSVERYDTRTYFRFADGTIIWRPDDKADVRLMGPKAGLTYPEGMDSALAKKWFGRVAANGTKVGFSEDKPLGRMWLGRKRFPRLTDVETDGARTYYRFADGTVAFQPEPDADVRIMGPAAKRGRYPEGLAKERATKWFGAVASRGMRYAFEEDAPVSKLWLGLGRLPKLDRVERYDARTYFRFADGTVIWRPNDEVDLRLLSD